MSKCANPECSEVFRYLHQGKIFLLSPTPEVQMATENDYPPLGERFWLCDKCSKLMTVVWGGKEAKLVILASATAPAGPPSLTPASEPAFRDDLRRKLRGRVASAGHDDG